MDEKPNVQNEKQGIEAQTVKTPEEAGEVKTTKKLIINGVPEEFKSFQEFAARVYQVKNIIAGDGVKNVGVIDSTTGKAVTPNSTWDELNDGDQIRITPKGNAGIRS